MQYDYIHSGANVPEDHCCLLVFPDCIRIQGSHSPSIAPKNGYAYVYVSNESAEPVYFDDIQVTHERKHIIEENHYYAYGLKIAAISSRKLGDGSEGQLKNNYLYQGDYSEYDEDIAWNDFTLRNYDPQIGRWVQVDPYDEFASPYVGMGNDPILNADPDGGSILSSLTGTIRTGASVPEDHWCLFVLPDCIRI